MEDMQRQRHGKAQLCSGDHGQINQAVARKKREICQESHIREGLKCWAKEAQWEAVKFSRTCSTTKPYKQVTSASLPLQQTSTTHL